MSGNKIYAFYGVNTAVQLLRPGAIWELSNTTFTKWDDPRPCPTWEEIQNTMKKIKDFEDSIDTIWLPEEEEEFMKQQQTIDNALENS